MYKRLSFNRSLEHSILSLLTLLIVGSIPPNLCYDHPLSETVGLWAGVGSQGHFLSKTLLDSHVDTSLKGLLTLAVILGGVSGAMFTYSNVPDSDLHAIKDTSELLGLSATNIATIIFSITNHCYDDTSSRADKTILNVLTSFCVITSGFVISEMYSEDTASPGKTPIETFLLLLFMGVSMFYWCKNSRIPLPEPQALLPL